MSTFTVTLYLVVLACLCVHAIHRSWLLVRYLRRAARGPVPEPEVWPVVTVQLPIFNERYVVEDLLRSVAALDYPRECLEIQVLDDSTDDTVERVAERVDALAATGLDIVHVHRSDRSGFKAGALEAGLARARGTMVAIFDADFRPPPSFLKATVPYLCGGDAMVQTRWGHRNLFESWLTGAQGTLLDGHFVVEHAARHAAGCWFNFNGTAGIWRREVIADAGGWQHDTLTEDLDLSYRAQLRGHRFRYLPDYVSPAELPTTIAAFKSQQYRWAKGSVQVFRKLWLRIVCSDAPLKDKLEATFHLTANFSYPLVVVLALLLPLVVLVRAETMVGGLFLADIILFGLATVPVIAFYVVAIVASGSPGRTRRLVELPLALALALGLSLAQSRAVFHGLFGVTGVFVRTPNGGASTRYRVPLHGLLVAEVAMAGYLVGALATSVLSGDFTPAPFLGLFALGFGLVGGRSAWEVIAGMGGASRSPDATIAMQRRRRPLPESK